MYKVEPFGHLSWKVINDEGDDYYVNLNPFTLKFSCHCTYNVISNLECKHIRMVKMFIKDGKSEFQYE